ncbi:MAG TPA: polysaccharide biosynthesis/export family protein [Candidatus Binataceae bacterium]|nr:polysaccharide biosynthesis/export family protein [Candidatus Binataceae bacterium]
MLSKVIRNTFYAGLACAIAAGFAACSSQDPAPSADPAVSADGAAVTPAVAAVSSDDMTRLDALWQQRTQDKSAGDFTVGPGDVLEISVPAIDELKDRSVRVSGDNTIALPLVGVINVKGLTEQGVRDQLKQRLQKYMYDPEVDVFTKEYESRQVAVVGMVQKPGLYTLTSPNDTILAMISRAGGTTAESAQRILLIPAPPGQGAATSAMLAAASQLSAPPSSAPVAPKATGAQGREKASASLAVERVGEGESVPASYQPQATQIPTGLASAEPIVIDLTSTHNENELAIPARPGDVIIVPAAGEVMVKGWVKDTGAFRITPGMTVLGAVTAAGGEMFSSDAVILRAGSTSTSSKIEIPVDLAAIQKGTAPDVAVQGGDVVIVNKSAAGAVPYALYTVFQKFSTGIFPALPFM